MIGWILLAVLALLVLLACTVRLGVLACYDGTGPWVKLRVGPKLVQVYPAQKDPDKEAKKKRKQAAKAAKQGDKPAKGPGKRDLGGALDLVWDLLPVVKVAAGRFRHKLRIDELTIDVTWAEEDPADAGIHYGRGWAVVEALLACLEANFIIKNRQVSLSVDFLAEVPRAYIRAGLSLTLAQLLAIALPAGLRSLQVLWDHRTRTKPPRPAAQEKKGEVNHGKESSDQ